MPNRKLEEDLDTALWWGIKRYFQYLLIRAIPTILMIVVMAWGLYESQKERQSKENQGYNELKARCAADPSIFECYNLDPKKVQAMKDLAKATNDAFYKRQAQDWCKQNPNWSIQNPTSNYCR